MADYMTTGERAGHIAKMVAKRDYEFVWVGRNADDNVVYRIENYTLADLLNIILTAREHGSHSVFM